MSLGKDSHGSDLTLYLLYNRATLPQTQVPHRIPCLLFVWYNSSYLRRSSVQKLKQTGGVMKRRLFTSGIYLLVPDSITVKGYKIENSAE